MCHVVMSRNNSFMTIFLICFFFMAEYFVEQKTPQWMRYCNSFFLNLRQRYAPYGVASIQASTTDVAWEVGCEGLTQWQR